MMSQNYAAILHQMGPNELSEIEALPGTAHLVEASVSREMNNVQLLTVPSSNQLLAFAQQAAWHVKELMSSSGTN